MSTYSWSYAPTSRAQCKGACKEKIQKGAVRLSHTYDETWSAQCATYTSTDHLCLTCAIEQQIENITSSVGGVELVEGFSSLLANDQAELLEKAGKTPRKYSWSYAPTSRATCKGTCQGKIQKGAVRLAVSYEDTVIAGSCTTHTVTDYHCLACAADQQMEHVTSAAGGAELVQGFDSLAAGDQAEVLKQAGKAPEPKAEAKGKAAAPEPEANSKGKASSPEPKAKAKGKAAPKREAKASVEKEHDFLDKAKAYDFEGVKAMVEEFPGIVCAQPAGRWSALHQFAAAGNVSAVKYLLEKGADKTCKAKDGAMPEDNAKSNCKALLGADEAPAKAARAPPPTTGEPPKKAAKGGC